MTEAWAAWDQVSADHRITYLPEPEGIEKQLRNYSHLSSPPPKVWADAYLLSFAFVAGVKLVTFDRALGRRIFDVLVL